MPALCYDLAGGSRRKAYMEAMLRFADFVANGTSTTPVCDFTPGVRTTQPETRARRATDGSLETTMLTPMPSGAG